MLFLLTIFMGKTEIFAHHLDPNADQDQTMMHIALQQPNIQAGRLLPATMRISNKRHSSGPLKSGVLRLGLRPMPFGKRRSAVKKKQFQPAQCFFSAEPSCG
jgi:hypothetical protein